MQDNFIISLKIKKTIEYVRKSTNNYPHSYIYLKNDIISSFYNILRLSYKASTFKDVNIMKEIIVEIKMIEYFIKLSYNYKLISLKKFNNVGEYLLEINKMINTWVKNEKSRKLI